MCSHFLLMWQFLITVLWKKQQRTKRIMCGNFEHHTNTEERSKKNTCCYIIDHWNTNEHGNRCHNLIKVIYPFLSVTSIDLVSLTHLCKFIHDFDHTHSSDFELALKRFKSVQRKEIYTFFVRRNVITVLPLYPNGPVTLYIAKASLIISTGDCVEGS